MINKKILSEVEQIALTCNTLEEFTRKYIETFDVPKKMSDINAIWFERAAKSVPLPPGPVPETPPEPPVTQKPQDSLPDEGVILSHISNNTAATYEILKDMLKVQADQLELFRKLANKGPVNPS